MITRRIALLAVIASLIATVVGTSRSQSAQAETRDCAAPTQPTILNCMGKATALCPLKHTDVPVDVAKKQSDLKDNAVRPGPGLIGRTFLEGKDVGIFFRYEHGKVFRHELIERKFIEKRDEKLPPKGVEIVLQGRLLVPRKMSVSARHAGGSVSHGVQTLFVDGKELGSVGDDRQKSRVYTLIMEAGTHTVKWVLTGGRFGNNLLRFEDPDTGKPLSLSYSAAELKDVGKISRNDLTVAASQERGWPIPQGW